MKHLERFLRSGSRLSETLKLIVVSVFFFGVIHWLRHDSIATLDYVASVPGNISARMEKRRRDMRNIELIEEAKMRDRDLKVHICKVTTKDAGELIRCLSAIEVE